MKLKYYLRGLGIGIVVMSVIMLINGQAESTKMTDEEIMARAKELGMIQSTVLSDIGNSEKTSEDSAEEISETASEKVSVDSSEKASEKISERPSDEPNDRPSEELSEKLSTKPSEKPSVDPSEKSSEKQSEKPSEKPSENVSEIPSERPSENVTGQDSTDETETVVITVSRGDGSDTVSRYMFEQGLVDDASAFDKFLCQNGYDKKLRVGAHEIKKGVTWEEMAAALTK